MHKVFLVLSILFIGLFVTAQSKDSTIYYTDYSQHFALSAYGIQKIGTLTIEDTNSEKKLHYLPNKNLNLGLFGQYKWIGLGIAVNFFPNMNVDKYGKSTSLNLGLTLTPKKWLIGFNLSFNRGMYLQNADEVINKWDGKSYHSMDSLSVANFNIGVLRVLNKNFSYKAAYSANQIQHKSAGSTLLGGFLSSYALSTDESLVPQEVHQNFATADSIRSLGLFSFGISGGYTYTFVIKKKFFINLYLVAHLGAQTVNIKDQNEVILNPSDEAQLTTGYQFKTSLGYNTDKWIAGLRYSTNAYSIKGISEADVQYDSNVFRIYFGYRFGKTK
ncbi:DUF4421 family protein [Carboxylicivirga sp. N1Y90]|uniref:DUF4421 family protein n=1 Tax=Carboxylicivirga fragile TaxID=3417571 RepID=UPI003D32C0FB|nr:DUF4421 family protein [Marinilabiliaceae bacterium N1Y90]